MPTFQRFNAKVALFRDWSACFMTWPNSRKSIVKGVSSFQTFRMNCARRSRAWEATSKLSMTVLGRIRKSLLHFSRLRRTKPIAWFAWSMICWVCRAWIQEPSSLILSWSIWTSCSTIFWIDLTWCLKKTITTLVKPRARITRSSVISRNAICGLKSTPTSSFRWSTTLWTMRSNIPLMAA